MPCMLILLFRRVIIDNCAVTQKKSTSGHPAPRSATQYLFRIVIRRLFVAKKNMEQFPDSCRVTDAIEGLVEGFFADSTPSSTSKYQQPTEAVDLPNHVQIVLDETKNLKEELAASKVASERNLNVTDSRLLSLEDKISTLETKVSVIERSMIEIDKTRRIEWALSLIRESETTAGFPSMVPFPPGSYRLGDSISPMTTADHFVRLVLLAFRKNEGKAIPSDFYQLENERCNLSELGKDAARQRFRDTVATHIHDLLGFAPRIAQEADGNYFIYFR